MNAIEFAQYLNDMHACADAVEWARGMTDSEAWEKCTRPAWLTWWIEEHYNRSRTVYINMRLLLEEENIRWWEFREDPETCNRIRAVCYMPTLNKEYPLKVIV